ncbi:MAG: VCBS repeat-containing protein [Planctomycetes bacterium]|nr:VCBS repeat-containing protein [Planctomycetota bacterium]
MTTTTRIWVCGLVGSLLCLGGSGCGFGTAAVVGSSSSDGGSSGQSVASALLAPRSPTSPASIFFVLTDQEGDAADVELRFRQNATEDFRPVTLAPGSAPLTQVPSKQTATRVLWDFATDLGGTGYHEGLEIQLVVKGGISPAVLTGVAQGNDAPQIVAAAPSPVGAEEYGGNTDVTFSVADSAGDSVRVKVEFNDDAAGGFPAAAWKPARPASTPAAEATPEFALAGVEATVSGTLATFRWDTQADLGGFDGNVRVRFTPADGFATGPTVTTAPFRIDNNLPPQVVVSDTWAVGTKDSGNIPVPFLLFDRESDPVRVLLQWRTSTDAYPALPTSKSDLVDLLDNPARAAERHQLQIGVEAPPGFVGRVGFASDLAPNQVRLPELAGEASWLLAQGLAGRTLEILRSHTVPQPVYWSSSLPTNPVAAIPAADETRALVLDADGVGWRLREIDLATGEPLRVFGTGAGMPRSLGVDPTGAVVFVGSSVAVFRYDRALGTALGSAVHAFTDGPRCLAPLGADVVAMTGDDALVRLDLRTGDLSTWVDGLAEPWGLLQDPLAEGRLYVAERASDRVRVFDAETSSWHLLAAAVAAADAAALGPLPLPSPRSLALENGGARLLVVSQVGAETSLRMLDLRDPTDFDHAPGDAADPFVRELTRWTGDADAGLATGNDALRLVARRSAGNLLVGGGIHHRARIVDAPGLAGGLEPYAPTTQVVTLTTPVAPVPGSFWRLGTAGTRRSDPIGRRQVFVWDTTEVPRSVQVQVRIVPIDGKIGFDSPSPLSLTVRPDFDVGVSIEANRPTDVVPVDLDGDGDLDLVATNNGQDQITLCRQTAPGVFTVDPTPLTAGDGPFRIATGDLDGDGDTDLVSVNTLGNSLTLFFQTAPGEFTAAAAPLMTGLYPWAVVAADLDGDGDLDLASADHDGNTVTLFFQAAAGVFVPAPGTLPVGGTATGVVAADLDGDGDVDLAVSVSSTNELALFLQSAPGTFAAGARLPSGAIPVNVVAADLDGDGDVDLATADGGSGTVSWFAQVGPGTFAADPAVVGLTGTALALTTGDLDHDGKMDLVATSRVEGFLPRAVVEYLRQTAPGVFTTREIDSVMLFYARPLGVATADLDGDGDLDVVTANYGLDQLDVRLQGEPGVDGFTESASPYLGYPTIRTADVDGDGDTDLVSSRTMSLQIAPGVFAAAPLSQTSSEVSAVDIDGDQDVDIVMLAEQVVVLVQSGPGVFQPTLLPSGTGAHPIDVVAADLDGDGDLDLATANIDSNDVSVFLQDEPGAFVFGGRVVAGEGPGRLAAADLDGDGDVDLVCANGYDGNYTILYQTQPAVFVPSPGPQFAGSYAGDVEPADVDGDGDVDLACMVVNPASGLWSLFVVLQTSPGVFSQGSDALLTSLSYGPVASADLNRDGCADLITARGVLMQRAPGVLQLLDAPADYADYSLGVADVDGDGDLDLVTSSSILFGGR